MSKAAWTRLPQFERVRGRGWRSAVAVLGGVTLAGCNGGGESDFPEPNQILQRDGALETDLYVQYAQAPAPGVVDTTGQIVERIWTRAYGTQPADPTNPLNEIPGPTLVFRPGDWLQIQLHNQLNKSANPWLEDFQDNVPAHSEDDIEERVPSEVNIPHNANNTNLHVHGLHVDPKDDNVTLLILPEDDDPSNYTPELQRLIPDIRRWWEWEYGYRIPADHLPGTHWYHAHKHGATSTQVENGMAGTLMIRPREESQDIVPGLWSADPRRTHDRVMVLQEIANYGVQQGPGRSLKVSTQASSTDFYTTDWPNITINGEHQPTLTVAPGQTERWRFVDAGANHRTAGYLWVGRLVPPDTISQAFRDSLETITDFNTARTYLTIGGNKGQCPFPDKLRVEIEPFPGTVKLVALDGVTLSEAVDVTYDRPALIGPGNRADLYIQPNEDAAGLFHVNKNYDVLPPQAELATHPNYGDLFAGAAGYWRYQALATCIGGTDVVNVAPGGGDFTQYGDLSHDPCTLGTSFTDFKQPWPHAVNVDGSIKGDSLVSLALAPLIFGRPDSVGVAVTPISGESFAFPGRGWAPTAGGPPSLVDAQVLFTINVEGPAVSGGPSPPSDERLSRLSPTTGDPANTLLMRAVADGSLEPGIPSYVSPITDADIAGTQVVVFDRSGIKFDYLAYEHSNGQTTIDTTGFNQFSLNGRQFDLLDFVGNPNATSLIQRPVPPNIANPFSSTDSLLGFYDYNAAGNYSNQVRISGQDMAFFTNPAYYVNVIPQPPPPGLARYYTYDNQNPAGPPDYTKITGLTSPHQPEATTAEEWLLVNNSRIFHPFHIHISPFLVTEVGQVSYDSANGWSTRTLQKDDPLGYVLDNWWDTIVIPPHGYIKIRLWLNIPDQKPSDPGDPNSGFTIQENANVFGSWVYHCHILRHEDRGMMMVVSVKPKAVP